jgi:hypothetical protein
MSETVIQSFPDFVKWDFVSLIEALLAAKFEVGVQKKKGCEN